MFNILHYTTITQKCNVAVYTLQQAMYRGWNKIYNNIIHSNITCYYNKNITIVDIHKIIFKIKWPCVVWSAGWEKVWLSKSNWFLRVHCILSNEKITRSQKSVSIADDWVKSASMSSVEITVAFHLIKS